jgi:hypothetical protein
MNLLVNIGLPICVCILGASSFGQTINAGDCTAILNNVQAGHDINVTIKCDQPTETKILDALFSQKWGKKDLILFPSNWTLHDELDTAGQYKFTPNSGNYFSQYDFTYSVSPNAGAHGPYTVFLFGDEIADAAPYGVNTTETQRLSLLRQKYPNNILSGEIFDQIVNGSPSRGNRLGYFYIRSQIRYEDGSDMQQSKITVYLKDNRLHSEINIFPFVDNYPEPNKDEIFYMFECDADSTMKTEIFVRLCKGLIERTTLSVEFRDAVVQ